MTLRIGGLFEGYGGLTRGVQDAMGGELAWYSEIDPAASRILAHHHPDVPNLGDITAVDWSAVDPVDVLTGGFPCQDISNAGKREGITGARSGLWSHYADAIRLLRPRYVVVENVGALIVRGLDRVLADLAALGFDAEWTTVRASSVGAPHRRERVFIAAADPNHVGHERSGETRDGRSGSEDGGLPVADTAGTGRREPRRVASGQAQGAEPETVGSTGRSSGALAPDSSSDGRWGDFSAAIERWELILGRPAPAPTKTGKRGSEQLSPEFVEWMQGLPIGHVTAVPGLTRNEMLKVLGNGVVPQQARAAVEQLLPLLISAREVAA